LGANLTTFAIAALAWQFSLPWWEIVLITATFYVGTHMAAGLSFKLW
jgi:hypothetical protein